MLRVALVAVCVALLGLAGCGYVGPVVPPSPRIPLAVTNLAAMERGDQIVITFSIPARTVDSLPIEEFSEIDLRIGPSVRPFDLALWENAAHAYRLPSPAGRQDEDQEAGKSLPLTKNIPAAEWEGKRIEILVRTAGEKRTHFSDWSNRVALDVVTPLQPPKLNVQATADGYKLTWTTGTGARRYQIFRQGPGEKTPTVNGISEKSEYVDGTAQWSTPYLYSVVAQSGDVESLPSNPVAADSPDTFAPAAPIGLVALAGPTSVELSWSRNGEIDLKGYELFRSKDGGQFQRQGELLTLPSFSDRSVEHGKHYRYAVGAVDQKGNVSARSALVEVTY